MQSTNNSTIDDELEQALLLIDRVEMNETEQERVMESTLQKWKNHINSGFLEYRKSVSRDKSYALLDWHDAFPGTPWFNDHRGQKYLDLLGGYGIYNVGRCHPDVMKVVRKQAEKQTLHSQELLDPLRAECAYLLSLVMPDGLKNVFFTNSGTESVEACLKMAMVATGRHTMIACVNGFHGKTLGSLSCTSKSAFRSPFLHSLNKTIHCAFNDCEALTNAFKVANSTGDLIAGVLIEPIQGEGGIHVGTAEFLRTARRLCDENGAMLIFDEVQSGMGRTGRWWACEHSNVIPDLMAIGKAFGGGVMPAGACVGNDRAWEKYIQNPFLFTTTFGGNPLAMAAAIATLAVIHRNQLHLGAFTKGEYFMKGLRRLMSEFPDIVQEIRGCGLMIGIEFQTNEFGIEFSKNMLEERILVAGTLSYAKTIRVEPALTIGDDDIDWALSKMRKVIYEIDSHHKKRIQPRKPVLSNKSKL